MIRLPEDWLKGQFEGFVARGGIIRFHAEDLNDPDHPDGKNKYAVILNTVLPASEIYFVFTTSRTDFYKRHGQFERALIRIPAGEYSCFPLETVVPFRNVRKVDAGRLKDQYAAGRLAFCGSLNAAHVAEMDRIVREGFFIHPRLRAAIQPLVSESDTSN